MRYLTGRQRTITYSGDITGSVSWSQPRPRPPQPPLPGCNSDFTIDVLQASISQTTGHDPVYWHRTLTVATGYGDSQTATTDNNPWSNYIKLDIGGSYTVSAEVEEVLEVEFGDWDDTYGRQAMTARLVEVVKEGGHVSVSATSGTLTASATSTVTGRPVISYELTLVADCSAAHGESDVTAVTANCCGQGLGRAYAKTNGDASANGANGVWVSCTSASDTSSSGSLTAVLNPDRGYLLSGVARRMAEPYEGTLGLHVDRGVDDQAHHIDAASGEFSDTRNQERYSYSCTLNGVVQEGLEVDQWGTLRASVRPGAPGDGDPYSLLALGEDTRDTQVRLRGPVFESFTCYQAATTQVDACESLTPSGEVYAGDWENVLNTTLTTNATRISIATGPSQQGAPSARRTFDAPGGGFAGYRYLRLTVQADASRTFTVGIGSKEWTKDYLGRWLSAGTVSAEYLLDLCSPTNESAETDTTDSCFPFPTADGPYYGVTKVDSIVLKDLANSATYYVEDLTLARLPAGGSARVTFLGEFDNWLLAQPPVTIGDTTTTTYVHRMVLGITDGRQSVELPDCKKFVVDSSGGQSISYGQISLATMADTMPGMGINPDLQPKPDPPGWHTTKNAALETTDPAEYGPLSDWLNNNRPATWAYGDGALWAKIPPHPDQHRWYYGLDIDARGTEEDVTVYAQMLMDSLDWYPGCGDALGLTDDPIAYGGPVVVAAAYLNRGRAHGLTISKQSRGQGRVRVGVFDATTWEGGGSGASDWIGWYMTSGPFGKGDRGQKVRALTPDELEVTWTFHDRKSHRACFRVAPFCGIRLFMPEPPVFFPFQPQFGDEQLLGVEEWRRGPLVSAAAAAARVAARPVRVAGHWRSRRTGAAAGAALRSGGGTGERKDEG